MKSNGKIVIIILILCLSLNSCKEKEELHDEEISIVEPQMDEQLTDNSDSSKEVIIKLENIIKNLEMENMEYKSIAENKQDTKLSIREAEIQYLRGIKVALGNWPMFLYPADSAEKIGELSNSRIRIISTFIVETKTWLLIELLEESYTGINSYGYIMAEDITDVEDEEMIISDNINIGGVKIGDSREQVIAKLGEGYAEQVGRGGNLLFYFDKGVEDKDKYTWSLGKPKYIDVSYGVGIFFDNKTRKVNKISCNIEGIELLDSYYIHDDAEAIIANMDALYLRLEKTSYMYDIGSNYYVYLGIDENKIFSITIGNIDKLD